jgi:hypothetical protein
MFNRRTGGKKTVDKNMTYLRMTIGRWSIDLDSKEGEDVSG